MSTIRRVSSFSASKILGNPIFSQLSQAQTTQDDGQQTAIYFVLPPGKTEELIQNSNLMEMYQTCQAHSLATQWIKDEDCADVILYGDGNIFVFDPFGSSGFKHWEKKMVSPSSSRLEILGPQVLRQVFSAAEVVIFQTKSFPTYSLAMKNMIVSLSGLKNKETKEELERIVKWMNGTLSSSLTKAVTHVVTVNATTRKCLEAYKEQIPVMTEEWIRDVWKDNQSNLADASDPKYVKYICPVFYNVNICMSQITAGRKNALKAGIERLGGKCSPDLVRGKTDVLVVLNPEGDKYKFAQKWKIHCVSPEWVENSTDCGHLIPMDDYKILPGDINRAYMMSTPAHSHIADFDTRYSMIEDEQSKLLINATHETSRTETHVHENVMVQLRATKHTGYLDGCKIYVVDYEKYDDLKRALNTSGAVRLNQLCEGVTHIIVTGHKLSKALEEKLKELDSMPYLVTIEWVLQSAKEGNPVDEDLYRFERTMDTNPGISGHNCDRVVDQLSVSGRDSHTVEVEVEKNTTITSKTPKSNSAESSRDADDSDTTHNPEVPNRSSYNPTLNPDATSPGLLVGISLKVVLPDDEEQQFLKNTILENSGKLTDEHAEVAILPPVCRPKDKDESEKSYTKYWLFDCLENGSLDVPNSFHYLPMPEFHKMNGIMKNVVFAISQYSVSEREYIADIVQAMGGRFQDVFAKRDSKDKKNLQSTHLICKNLETDKAKAAKRWEVPVVLAEWAIESFSEKKRLNEEKYNPEQQNTSDSTVFMPTPQRRQVNNAKPNTNNVSVRSVYPPSNVKSQAIQFIRKKDATPEPEPTMNVVPVEPDVPNIPADVGERGLNQKDTFRTPTLTSKEPVPGPSSKLRPTNVKSMDNRKANELVHCHSKCPEQDEIDQRMAELKARDPYTDESFNRLMNDIKVRGYNLDEVSPFTSMEDDRLCNPDPDSPLLLDLPRHESRALKEQIEVALQLSPIVSKIKLRHSPSTPMSEIVKRFNAVLEDHCGHDSSYTSSTPSNGSSSSPHTSTPKSGGTQALLRKVAAINRLSNGDVASISQTHIEIDGTSMTAPGIKKLGKRPSDGSPEDEKELNTSKRRRKSSEADYNENNGNKTSTSPNENISPKNGDVEYNEKNSSSLSSSKKSDRMQTLANLIAKNKANASDVDSSLSPIKRRSGGDSAKNLVPIDVEDEICEEVEQPHLSWVDNDRECEKVSTTKKRPINPVIEPPPQQETSGPETRKRSSRQKKTNSIVNSDNGNVRVTRSTRSQSKNRETVPIGHEPIQLDTEKKSRKKKHTAFPLTMSENPSFMFSSISNEKEKLQLTGYILELGGKASDLAYFDPDCVGLFAGSLIRSEKVLGCIASGKYIFKLEYLTDSYEAGRFLPIYEKYIWNESNIKQEKERDLARASFNWFKIHMTDNTKRPMSGMKFCLLDKKSSEKSKAFTRLIEASGGEVTEYPEEATCFIKEEKSSVAVPIKGIPVKTSMHINDLILSDPPM